MLAISLRIAAVVHEIGVGICVSLVVHVDKGLNLGISRCVRVDLQSSPYRIERERLHGQSG